jgi:subtilisin family serine protease
MKERANRLRPAFFFLALAFLAAGGPAAEQKPPPGASECLAGEVLVRFKPGTTAGATEVLAAELGVEDVREFRVLSRLRRRPFVLMRSTRRSTVELLAALRARPGVEALSPNYRRRLLRLPDDPKYSKQWGLERIAAPAAWDLNTGSSGVVLAVIDTGVDYRHEDLAANMWRNPDEIAGNGIDDDGNGFVDDVYGYDFAAGDDGRNDDDPMDIDGHGTHVAGIMAAAGDNGIGVCGVNWHARIMALKAFRPNLNLYDSDCIEAIEYAVMMKREHGVNLAAINASFGGSGEDELLKDAIAEAGDNGIAFVCAAGNDGGDNDESPFYPSSYDLPGIVSVAASDEGDQLASFSNYGAGSVDIAAPGQGILSTVPAGKGLEAWLRSGSEQFDANPMEYSGLTPAAGLSRLLYDCGRGESAADFPAGVHGNIALIERGGNTFSDKAARAQGAGAVGAAIYNNASGNFSGTLGSSGGWMPVVSLSRADGLELRGRGVHAVNLTCRTASYGIMDGTSMAAPHVCGALGLLAAQYPNDGLAKRLSRLYSGADRLAALAGKVKTGARLDLARSLTQSLVLALTASRRQAGVWVVTRDYAEVYFSVEKNSGSTISGESYTIYRRGATGDYQAVKTVAAGELQDNAYTYLDKFLDHGTAYTYVVQALSTEGDVLALSNEQTI